MGNFKHIIMAVIVLLSFLVVAVFGAPPRVIKTVPENGAQDVNPRLRQIRIVFDQDMNRDGYSICGGGPNYPETIGKPRWTNKRTIVMRVRLVPNHKYQLSINCPSAKNFRNTQGEPVEPNPIEFRTGSSRRRTGAGALRRPAKAHLRLSKQCPKMMQGMWTPGCERFVLSSTGIWSEDFQYVTVRKPLR